MQEYWIADPGRVLLTQFVRPVPGSAGDEASERRVRVHDDLRGMVQSSRFDLNVSLSALYALVFSAEDAAGAGDTNAAESS